MRKIYLTIYLVSALSIMTIMVSSCFENEDDIAAPSLKIFQSGKLLSNDDTVTLINNNLYCFVVGNNL